MTEYDSTVPGHDTDWLANSVYGYGFGYTKEQALTAMAANVKPTDNPVKVNLVEHVGSVTVGPGSVNVNGTFVRQEVVEIDPEAFNELRDSAIDVTVSAETTLDNAELVDSYEPDGDDG